MSVAAQRTEPMADGSERRAIKVFVHLARDKDARAWKQALEAGTLVGFNEETPYGYGRANSMGCEVRFSSSRPESMLSRGWRLALRALTGFDLAHAQRQRAELRDCDVVWTHTESQFLAVAAALGGTNHRPKLLGQSVWLFDRWEHLGPWRRAWYRRLIARIDTLTVHSDSNLAIARRLFPEKRIELVRFGVPSEYPVPPRLRTADPLRILSVGSDRHRDWPTLLAAVADLEAQTTILSGTLAPSAAAALPKVEIRRARTNSELVTALQAATLVCVPLKPNQHASGITAIQEAVLSGVPVVATDTGGLTGYFGPDEIRYVPPGDAGALRDAIISLAQDPQGACAMASRAQSRMTRDGLGAETFIRRHVELTEDMLAR